MAKANLSRRRQQALTSIELLLIDAQLQASSYRFEFLTYLLAMALTEVHELRRPRRKSQ